MDIIHTNTTNKVDVDNYNNEPEAEFVDFCNPFCVQIYDL